MQIYFPSVFFKTEEFNYGCVGSSDKTKERNHKFKGVGKTLGHTQAMIFLNETENQLKRR